MVTTFSRVTSQAPERLLSKALQEPLPFLLNMHNENAENHCFAILFPLTTCGVDMFGQGWYWQNPLPQGNELNDVHILEESCNGCLASGILLETTDGGSAWVVHRMLGAQNKR